MDLESELGGWPTDACAICYEEGVILHRYRAYGTSEDIYVCPNCRADLRDMQKERLRP